MYKANKVIRISFAGGILGLIFGSSRGKVETMIQKRNLEGWNVAEVIEDSPNLIILILRLILLILTLGLWTISTGYLFILERPMEGNPTEGFKKSNSGRVEPRISAT